MNFFEIFLIGVGLSMDALAASICKGAVLKGNNIKNAAIIGLFFGGFQALMPFIGYLAGSQAEKFISSFDHWIAFGLLAILGGKMIFDSFNPDGESCDITKDKLDYKELFMLAVATSIDALVVGISFGMLGTNIGGAVAVIGCTTFAISVLGVLVGKFFGSKFEKQANIAGGCILILIGLKILLEHLDILRLPSVF